MGRSRALVAIEGRVHASRRASRARPRGSRSPVQRLSSSLGLSPLALLASALVATQAWADDAGALSASQHGEAANEGKPARLLPSFVPGWRSRSLLSDKLRSRLKDSIRTSHFLGTEGTPQARDDPAEADESTPAAPPTSDEAAEPASSLAPEVERRGRARGRRLRSFQTADGVTVLSNRPTPLPAEARVEVPPPRLEPEELRRGTPRLPLERPPGAQRAVATIPATSMDDALAWQLGLLTLVAVGLSVTGLVLWRRNQGV